MWFIDRIGFHTNYSSLIASSFDLIMCGNMIVPHLPRNGFKQVHSSLIPIVQLGCHSSVREMLTAAGNANKSCRQSHSEVFRIQHILKQWISIGHCPTPQGVVLWNGHPMPPAHSETDFNFPSVSKPTPHRRMHLWGWSAPPVDP